LHAKCVSVDGERAFVSSANFTMRAHERNIEVGVLLHDRAFAAQLERQWMSLVDDGLVCTHVAGRRTRRGLVGGRSKFPEL
jgi:phosphatidylserine/phosphatidylglycerophosphate/cardiolipin synthase-like enzyme